MPDVLFFGDPIPDLAGKKTDERRHRSRKPFVKAEWKQADQRASEQADDPAAEKSHEERSFKREVEKSIAGDQTQHDANGQRRHHEEKEHHFFVGVAVLGEDQLAKSGETHE